MNEARRSLLKKMGMTEDELRKFVRNYYVAAMLRQQAKQMADSPQRAHRPPSPATVDWR